MINTQTKRFLPLHTLCIAHLCTVVRMLMYILHFLPCSFFLSALETFCERSTNVWKRLFQDSKRAVASKRNGELVVFFLFIEILPIEFTPTKCYKLTQYQYAKICEQIPPNRLSWFH